jgi:hypothetical protein
MQSPQDVVAAVKEKQVRDNTQVAELIRRGTPAAAARTNTDGGMHETFRNAVASYNVDDAGVVRNRVASTSGTIPANIRLPGDYTAAQSKSNGQATGSVSEPVVPVETRVASAQPGGGGLFGNLFASNSNSSSSAGSNSKAKSTSESSGGGVMDGISRLMGWSSSEPAAPTPTPKTKAKSPPKQTAAVPRSKPTDAKEAKQPAAKQTANAGAIRPKDEPARETEPSTQQAAAQPAVPSGNSLVNGAQPTVPSGAFDNRFGAWR